MKAQKYSESYKYKNLHPATKYSVGIVWSFSSQGVRHIGENMDKPEPEQEEELMIRKLIS